MSISMDGCIIRLSFDVDKKCQYHFIFKTLIIERKTMTNTNTQPKTAIIPDNTEHARTLVLDSGKYKTQYLAPIARTSKKLRELVQDAAIQAMLQAFGHENYDFMNKLFTVVEDNMSKSNAKQLRVFFEKYAPVVMRKTDEGYRLRKDTKDNANEFDFVQAFENPWFTIDLKTDDEIQAMFSFAKLNSAIEALIKKAEKAIEGESVENPDELPLIMEKVNLLKDVTAIQSEASQATIN